jgi:hypothetical protein
MAPINHRYRQLVQNRVPWREILEAANYQIARRRTFSDGRKLAFIQQRLGHQEVFYLQCLWHEERSASLCLGVGGMTCFGCQETGDKVDFVAHLKGLQRVRDIKQYFADTFPQMQPRTT